MQERIQDIAKSIKRHRELELSVDATNSAVGCSKAIFNKEEMQFWIIVKEATIVQYKRDFNGNLIPESAFAEKTTYKHDGKPVSRDSKLGGLLIQFYEGKHMFRTPMGEVEIEILNQASYTPSKRDDELATDILIKLAGNSKTYSFQNISKILSLQAEIEEERAKLEQARAARELEEAQRLVDRIESKESEIKSYLAKAQGFIRKYAELRYQPILDPIQDSIRRSKIFDGALIINGGPGTGKTTSLIQRIKFLISETIKEYFPLSSSQSNILFNQKTSWIFYSPNELLALFLRNSMKMEELKADDERVKVWGAHKNELIRVYKLVDTATKRPFLFYNKSRWEKLLINQPRNIREVISRLNLFFLEVQKDKLDRVLEIDVSPFKWKNTGLSIQKFLKGKEENKDFDGLIRLFLNLNETYKVDSDQIAAEYSQLIKSVAGRICVQITKESERASEIADLFNQWKSNGQEVDEEEEDDDTEIESEDFEEKESQLSVDFERELFVKLKSLCRKQALRRFDKNTKFSKRDQELFKLIPEVEEQKEYEQIGQTAFFKKYFERIIKGVLANILREIPMVYKKFRRKQWISKSGNWDLQILGKLVNTDKNSRIHPDEQALLLLFINEICFRLSKEFKQLYGRINHPYLNAYKAHCKPIIAIDEATDFAIIDLLSICSFRHPELSSVTLSGDVMQRLTVNGLNSWEDFIKVAPGTEIKNLEVSYRQSPTLLSLAQSIYEVSTGKKAEYKSYIKKDEAEPRPLLFVSEDEEEKLNWISERILEIYRAYGDTIPSIAIFMPDESHLDRFARQLGNLDILSDVGILVKACKDGEVLGDKNTVRIFSIDKIKGLEFEAVFFHDFDDLLNQNLPHDLLLKYLYVGLSRATFYLGLTLSEELDGDLKFISDHLDRTGKNWRN